LLISDKRKMNISKIIHEGVSSGEMARPIGGWRRVQAGLEPLRASPDGQTEFWRAGFSA
jgi:hypothetical protein